MDGMFLRQNVHYSNTPLQQHQNIYGETTSLKLPLPVIRYSLISHLFRKAPSFTSTLQRLHQTFLSLRYHFLIYNLPLVDVYKILTLVFPKIFNIPENTGYLLLSFGENRKCPMRRLIGCNMVNIRGVISLNSFQAFRWADWQSSKVRVYVIAEKLTLKRSPPSNTVRFETWM